MKKRMLCALLSLSLVLALSVPALAVNRDWESAYRSVINREADTWGSYFQLVDLNLDGTPELIQGGYPGSGLFSILEGVYTFENGGAKILKFGEYDKLSTSGYNLYRNNATGAYRIEGGYILRAGAGYYADVTATYSLNNGTLKVTDAYVKDTAGSTVTYYIGGTKVSASKYNSAYNARNSGWTRIGSFGVSELMKGYKKPTSGEIQTFFDQYTGSPALATYSTHKIQVDGKPVSIAAYGINGNNYFKLRDLAALLNGTEAQFQVGWNDAARTITLTTGKAYTAVGGELAKADGLNRFGTATDSPIYIDGALADLTAYNIDGNNYFKLRDLGKALGFNVGWDDATRTVSITTDEPYTE